ncbi:ArsR/SmtB family transcription factor [Streptantibioticus silvisoli]|uniref:Metalloregulator ArsR/SmtB family transcription factor n=1 Tax=Streptantibioticus silvisoli TaxID=2705255 RepID=A0ABT6VUK2_9ACTN|nr:metalloregulator ArsR/SmtB family transcription factor [Streptantibioticus silvisoli]MDI5961744.1 metalloregulator ArsR/SmtB family transcription factor [Streptantibioticus silvisoli]
MNDDRVFKALADPTRRLLLDRLFERDGRTLTELQCCVEMTRFGVMKHLKVLEEAGLVVSRRHGRVKLHFLDGRPIRLIRDHWIDKYDLAPPPPGPPGALPAAPDHASGAVPAAPEVADHASGAGATGQASGAGAGVRGRR